jgi:YfiH family protein
MSFVQISLPGTPSGKRGLTYYQSPQLRSLPFLIHAFTTRIGGVSVGYYSSLNFSVREGDPEEHVKKNFQIIADAFDVSPEQFLTVRQVHGDGILVMKGPDFRIPEGKPLEYDGIITDQTGIAVGVKTADCVPILIVDKIKRIIGVVHAGWRGTALKIAAKAVMRFREDFSSETGDMVAAIGPSIGPCCYQVDEQVYRAMEHGGAEPYFGPCEENGRWMLDLPSLNRQHLVEAGLSAESVGMSGLCTACLPDLFYSHRGESGRTGRQLNFLMLQENRTSI